MSSAPEIDGLLISGAYGAGKSSLAAEIAETLERSGVSYGALDLDWLTWFGVPGMDRDAARRVYLSNVAAVARHYRDFGVRHLVLAGAVRDRAERQALEAATAASLRVVRLEVPIDEIARRLGADPTTGRRDDLEAARQWVAAAVGVGIEDLAIPSVGPISETARRIIEWLGWTA